MGDTIRIDPKKQFSKRLARWTAVFWFFYLTWLSILMMLEPTVAAYCLYMSIVVSVIMMVNVIAYTRNSIAEKLAFTLLDKTKIELTLGNRKREDADEIDDEPEEVSNG